MCIRDSIVADLREGPEQGWEVLADPEGNEFGVLRRTQA